MTMRIMNITAGKTLQPLVHHHPPLPQHHYLRHPRTRPVFPTLMMTGRTMNPDPNLPPHSLNLEPWGTPLPDTLQLEFQTPSSSASLELVFRAEADVMDHALIPYRPSTPILNLVCHAPSILADRYATDFALESSLWHPQGPSLVRVRVNLYITRHEAILLFLALWILSRYL